MSASTLGLAGTGLAQSGPSTVPGGVAPPAPVAQTPYWNGNGAGYGGNGQSSPYDLPAADIRAVAPARANAVRAR